jgi:hypothetical protein
MDHFNREFWPIQIDKEVAKSENIDLHEIVRNIIDIIHLPDHISVSIIGTPRIKADKFRMQQFSKLDR